MFNNKLLLVLSGFLLTNSFVSSQGLLTASGAQVIANGNVSLVLKNAGFTNHGVFAPGTGEVIFSGSGSTAGSFINGTSATGFYKLTLNKSANGIQLGRNISVSNLLTFTSGDSLFLNGFNIDLGSTGSLSGETESKRITGRTGGYVQATQVLNAPTAVNPGNLGYKVTSAANMGSTVIRRGHVQQSGASIYRYYDVTPTTNTGLNATIDFYYFNAELAGLAEPNLGLFSSANGGVQWSNLGEDGIDQSANILTLAGINVMNRFTLANISAPLSVKLIRFFAVPEDRVVVLHWVTSAETANQYFAVERSADGVHFMEIGRVNGAGTSVVEQNYQYTDQLPLPASSWYRLRQVDLDGKYTYSPVLMINLLNTGAVQARVYPNPVTGPVAFINLTGVTTGSQQLQLYNPAGMLIKQIVVTRVAGTQVVPLETGNLPAGIYTIRISGNTGYALTFIKQ